MLETPSKSEIVTLFTQHVSSAKAAFFKTFGMELVIDGRDGIWIEDLESGRRLINLHCNGGVYNLGHNNPELRQVLKNNLDRLDIGNGHLISRERALLASELAKLMPGDLDYVIFGVSGGEAVDLAIKVARGYTGRREIISASGGYHGHTGLALAVGDPRYRDPFGPPLPGFQQIPFGDEDALLSAVSEKTAAVILETVPATLGIIVPSDNYFRAVRKQCDQTGTLLILDEVQTGLGRTGKLWGFEHFDVLPDMVVLGKGLSGGIYPLTATVIRTPLESVFHADPFIHVSTFGGAELGCVVTRKVLEMSSDFEFLLHINMLAQKFKTIINRLHVKHEDIIVNFHQLGLMMGLVTDSETSGLLLCKAAYEAGLLMVYANNAPHICQFLPPLIVTETEADLVGERLEKAITLAKQYRQQMG